MLSSQNSRPAELRLRETASEERPNGKPRNGRWGLRWLVVADEVRTEEGGVWPVLGAAVEGRYDPKSGSRCTPGSPSPTPNTATTMPSTASTWSYPPFYLAFGTALGEPGCLAERNRST
jgi:hypothetical protein